ncbi:MAG: DUF885 domain-containing protein [Bacteroidetes bacterium]|nr:DUF885 domain-containing protein [Bacteroidota bacterium]
MKIFVLLTIPVLILFSSCASDPRSDADISFEQFADRFLERYLAMYPEQSTNLGDHRYDVFMNESSREAMKAQAVFFEACLDTLRSLRVETLSPQHMVDYDILQCMLERTLFQLTELREWEWNPLVYNTGEAIYALIARDFAPLDDRMRSVVSRLRAIPAVLEAARNNLNAPPFIHTETALLQNNGTIALLNNSLQPFIDQCDTVLQQDVLVAREHAVAALEDYGAWLRRDLMQRSTGDFRLGKKMYAKKFALRLDTDMAPERLLVHAERELEITTRLMHSVASRLHSTLFQQDPIPEDSVELIRRVLNRLAEHAPNDENIVDHAREALEEARLFVAERQLVTLPVEPIRIIVMPEFQRGVAVAYCDAPGALEKNGDTFFAIAPTPEDWTPARRKSFYREYNEYMLKNLTIHEAVPGHYLQLAAANRAETPTLLRAVFPSGVFAEGWATYTEQMMVDEGFGGPELHMQVLKMRLRLLINAIIDQRIHTMNMSEREAMQLMMERGFQEEGEAAGKWRRACLTSAQLSTYFYGNMRINEIRRRAERRDDTEFSLRTFHDELLSFGTISPKYLPMIMKLPTEPAPVAAM